MTYKQFFEYIETQLYNIFKEDHNVFVDKVHTKNTVSCSVGNGETSITGTCYEAIHNDGYNTLHTWSGKFIEYEVNTNGIIGKVEGITEIPIIRASRSNDKFLLYIGSPDSVVNKPYIDSNNGFSQYGTMFKPLYYAMMNLFISLDTDDNAYRFPDLNYNLINGYADGSKSLDCYNKSTQEFYKRAEYWNVRGHLYEFLAEAEDGFYKKYKTRVEELLRHISSLQIEYDTLFPSKKYVKTTSCHTSSSDSGISSTPTREVSSAELFWTNARVSTLKSYLSVFDDMKNDVNKIHNELIGIVNMYLYYYSELTEWLSKGETFISALQKTSTSPGTCLADSFDKLNRYNCFKYYSPNSLDKGYEYFLRAKNMRDKSKYAEDDDHNMYLRKFLTFVVIEDFKFFDNAVFLLNKIINLRNNMGFDKF